MYIWPIMRNLPLKYKLMAAFLVTIIPIMFLAGYVSYAYLERSYMRTSEKELRNSADTLARTIETAARLSLKNYLRSAAEKNLEIIRDHYATHMAGRMNRDEMVAGTREFLNQQSIGSSGYIYIIDSRGTIVLHPNAAVQGSSVLQHAFVRDQIARKEGFLEYDWRNPEEDTPRRKALYMTYFEPLDWIISVSAYRDEFKSLIQFEDIREVVSAMRFGDAGYAFITDEKGDLLIHPRKNLANNIAEVITDGKTAVDAVAAMKNGQLRYTYIDPDSKTAQAKLAYFKFIPEYGWYVGASYPEAEIFKPLQTIRTIIIFMTLLVLAIAVAVATWFSSYINTHLQRLNKAFEEGASGFFSGRLQTGSGDEFGRLAQYYNTFMKRLESYQQSLLAEIDKRRQMQNAVYESEKRLKNLVRNAPVLLWAIDHEGLLTFHEGTLPDQIDDCGCMTTGQPLKELWGRWEQIAGHIDRALNGLAGNLLIQQSDYAIEIHYNPLVDAIGQANGAVGVAIDVTSRWQAERRLGQAEQERLKLAMAVEQAAEIIVITDTSGTIEYVNPAFEKSSGYTRSEALGKNPRILKSGSQNDTVYGDLWQTISRGNVWSGRLVNKKKDGTLFYEEATISPLRDENGTIVSYVASKRDVTQEVILQDQLHHSQRMKAIGTLAGGIAHDFNNILSGIMGYTEMCLYEAPAESALSDRLKKVLNAGQRAKELITHIQTFSRQSNLEPIPMLPGPVVEEAVKLVQTSYPTVDFTCKVQKVGAICAVPTQIHQIVMNLCTNGCHAMQPNGGRLMVSLAKKIIDAESARRLLDISEGAYAELTVTDTGPGIAKEIIGKIFDPYFTTKAEGEGTGLGLSVVHGIVKSLQGVAKVYSEPGTGTTFKIMLPLHSMTGRNEALPKLETPIGHGESLLLVDDQEDVLESTREILESLNYRVTALSSTLDALKLFEGQPDRFDMVVTDFSVPKMNGAQFATAVKKLKDIPVLVSTGFSYDERLEQVQAAGIAELINKPIIRVEMALKIAGILCRRRAAAEKSV